MGKSADVTADLRRRLRMRYPLGEWATAEEVRNGCGHVANLRAADFVAVSCWPSKGDLVIGLEVKASKSDWSRELANPAKRKWLEDQVTELWVVAPCGMIPTAEVPDGMGLLEAVGDQFKLRAKVKARQYADREPGPDFWRSFCRALSERERLSTDELTAFAEFKGRTLTLTELRRLGLRAHLGAGHPADPYDFDHMERRRQVQREIEREAEGERRARKIKGEQFRTKWRNAHLRLWNAGAELGLVEHLRGWGGQYPEDPDQLEAVVSALVASVEPAKMAEKLRSLASSMASMADDLAPASAEMVRPEGESNGTS